MILVAEESLIIGEREKETGKDKIVASSELGLSLCRHASKKRCSQHFPHTGYHHIVGKINFVKAVFPAIAQHGYIYLLENEFPKNQYLDKFQ